MAFYGAFWGEAFWNQAFQVARISTPEPDVELLGGGGYVHPYVKHREEEYQREKLARAQAKLRRVEDELAEAERQKLLRAQALKKAKKDAAKQLAALQASLEEEISRLRTERVWLMRLIEEEEIILLLIAARKRLRLAFH